MISLILPAYNAEKYLRECLDSALGQSYADIEIIVVDDGSTDSTPEIAAEYAARDPRVRVFSKANGGPSEARNFGIGKSKGDYLCFLDSDDCLYPDSLEILYEGIATGAPLSTGRFTREKSVGRSKEVKWRVIDSQSAIADMMYQKSVLPSAWGKLFDRRLFDNITFREGITYEDLDVLYRVVAEAGKIAVTDSPVYFYRFNSTSLTNVFSAYRFDVLKVAERLEGYVAENFPALLPAARDRRLSANFNMLGLIALHDADGRYADIADSCWEIIKSYRRASLLDPHVRLKNKLGILCSYLGRGVLETVSKKFYGRSAQ